MLLQRPITTSILGARDLCGLSRSRLYELIADGTIEAVKAGRKTLIVTASLENYLAGLPRAEIAGRTKHAA